MVPDETAKFREMVQALIDESRDHLAMIREALASTDAQINSSMHAVKVSRKRLELVRDDPIWGRQEPAS